MAQTTFGEAKIKAVGDLMRADDRVIIIGGAGFGALAFLTLRPDAVSPVIETQVAVAATAPVDPADTAGRQWDQLDPSDAERLNAYLISYSQSRAQQGMGSTLGYARFAAHTAEYRPQRIQGPTAQPVALRETR